MKTFLSIAAIVLFVVGIYIGRVSVTPTFHPVSSDTVYVVDTLRFKQPYPVYLPGEILAFEDTTKLDSLKRIYADSIGALLVELAKPFRSRYDDSIRTTYTTAYPIDKLMKDSTFYKPIPFQYKIITNVERRNPTLLEYLISAGIGAGAVLILK